MVAQHDARSESGRIVVTPRQWTARVAFHAWSEQFVLVVTRDRRAEVPFGPSLVGGAVVGAWLGPVVFRALA